MSRFADLPNAEIAASGALLLYSSSLVEQHERSSPAHFEVNIDGLL